MPVNNSRKNSGTTNSDRTRDSLTRLAACTPPDVEARRRERSSMSDPPLRPLHSPTVLSQAKLQRFRALGTADLIESLRPGRPGALVTRPDGTVLEGNHRLAVLRERGIEIDRL